MVFLLLLACAPGTGPGSRGTDLAESFPFDGEARTWTYRVAWGLVPWELDAEVVHDEAWGAPGERVYPVEYVSRCVLDDPECVGGAEMLRIEWQSSPGDGVYVHGWSVEEGDWVALDPPVQLAPREMSRGDVVTTETGGHTWTSEWASTEDCPVHVDAVWDSCVRLRVDTDAPGTPLRGDWWVLHQRGVVAFHLDDHWSERWGLTDMECAPDETCDGSW